MQIFKHFIDGRFVPAAGGASLEVYEPGSGAV